MGIVEKVFKVRGRGGYEVKSKDYREVKALFQWRLTFWQCGEEVYLSCLLKR